MKSKIIPCH